jgi:prepilin-type N-terminal cleavage/methylation domain-containing protein
MNRKNVHNIVNNRSAFTLVELLVVIAIIGILVALLLPAVQAARGAARRMSCSNNLKQLGIAMHLHVGSNKVLPANGNYAWNGSANVATNAWSASARLLPYIEQENLFRGIDFTQSYNVQLGIASKRVDTFMCPSEINDRGHGVDPTYGNKTWPINYALSNGTWPVFTAKSAAPQTSDGAFGPNRGYSPAAFTDGLSNTLAASEVKAFTNRGTGGSPPAVPPTGAAAVVSLVGALNPTSFTHVEWVDGKVHETGFTTVLTPNTQVIYPSGGVNYDIDYVSATETNAADTYAAVTSRSFHSSGVNSLLMDGSVRFMSNSIDLFTWRALGTRGGSEIFELK